MYFSFRTPVRGLFFTGALFCGVRNFAQDILPAQRAYENEAMHNQAWCDKSLTYAGDPSNIKTVFEKARAGKTITIGCIGGSITEGAGASDPSHTAYASLIRTWWQQQFPHIDVRFVNAGIGATGSVYAVHRVNKDLLYAHPDLTIVDFSVNDIRQPQATEAYEGLMRKMLRQNPRMGILAISMTWNNGENWQEEHLKICRHYGIPMISYRDAIWPEVSSGKIAWKDISPDVVHPNDRGHAYIAGLAIHFFEELDKSPAKEKTSPALPQPLTANKYERSKIIEFTAENATSKGTWTYTGKGWLADHKGAPLEYKIRGKCFTLVYRRTNKGTGANAYVLIDKKTKVPFDADFKEGWGDYPAISEIFNSKKSRLHRLSFYFDDDRKDRDILLYRILVAE